MKALNRFTCVLCSVVLVLLTFTPPAQANSNSYCDNCVAAIVAVAVAVGVGIGVGIYFIHRGHTSLSGCVQQTDTGLSLVAKNGNNYELLNAPIDVKPHRRFSLRGHKVQRASGRGFRVDHVSRDYGVCAP